MTGLTTVDFSILLAVSEGKMVGPPTTSTLGVLQSLSQSGLIVWVEEEVRNSAGIPYTKKSWKMTSTGAATLETRLKEAQA